MRAWGNTGGLSGTEEYGNRHDACPISHVLISHAQVSMELMVLRWGRQAGLLGGKDTTVKLLVRREVRQGVK